MQGIGRSVIAHRHNPWMNARGGWGGFGVGESAGEFRIDSKQTWRNVWYETRLTGRIHAFCGFMREICKSRSYSDSLYCARLLASDSMTLGGKEGGRERGSEGRWEWGEGGSEGRRERGKGWRQRIYSLHIFMTCKTKRNFYKTKSFTKLYLNELMVGTFASLPHAHPQLSVSSNYSLERWKVFLCCHGNSQNKGDILIN